MKKQVVVVAAAALLAAGVPISADAPTVTINSPTAANTVFSATFPFAQPIAFTVYHGGVLGTERDITDVKDLEVLINGTAIIGSAVAVPWKSGGSVGCNLGGTPVAAPYTACATPDPNTGTGTINWTVPNPGTYTITVRVKHASDTGEDEESVMFALLTAEYPAPPAVANAYIKSTLGRLAAKVHGCVISSIAEKHAKDSAYGPRGGPYNQGWIEGDVNAFRIACGG
jgi:hypothetical protein